ncbi:MAG: SPOR domain-containing protein [Promethearchaeota archaeon]|jgi:nucleoid DNA-binding protein
MTKNELVKIISEKAKISDSSARELFDIFLIRISDRLTVGQTAHLENVGYFHLRKGKVRKPEKVGERDTFESHDFLVLSQSSELKIKSPGYLVLMVPEIEIQNRDSVDSHFKLGVDEPGIQYMKDGSTISRLSQLSVEKRNELNKKVDIIMSELKTEKSISSKYGVLLVESKKFSKDHFEMNIDDSSREKESLNLSNDTIDSTENKMDTAEHFEKDHSQKLDKEPIEKETENKTNELDKDKETDLNIDARDWEKVSEPLNGNKIELDKKVYEDVADTNSTENDESNILYEGLNKPILGASENSKNEEKKPSGSGDDKINRKFKRIKLKGPSIEKKRTIEKKVSKKIPPRETDIDQEKEKAKENESNKYQKVTDGENQMHTEKFKEPSKIKESLASMSELEEDEDAFDTEIKETYRGRRDRVSGMPFLLIIVTIIVIGGGLYFFLTERDNGESVITQTALFDNTVNTTYLDRNYDVPVTYPYSQSESEVQLHGLSSELSASEVAEEQSGIEESTTKLVNNKDNIPPKNEVIPSKNEIIPLQNENTPPQKEIEQASTAPRKQVAQNVFKYNETYVVQIAAFRTKKDAENGAAKFIKSGYSAFVEEAIVGGKNWFRLRVGGFKTLEAAKQYQKSKK